MAFYRAISLCACAAWRLPQHFPNSVCFSCCAVDDWDWVWQPEVSRGSRCPSSNDQEATMRRVGAARIGLLDMRAQPEIHSALRTDTPERVFEHASVRKYTSLSDISL